MIAVVVQVVIGALDLLITSAAGWRYLLSPRYRALVRARPTSGRRTLRAMTTVGYVTFFLVGNVILVILLVYVYEAAAWIYDGIVAPRLLHGI